MANWLLNRDVVDEDILLALLFIARREWNSTTLIQTEFGKPYFKRKS